mgnify:CR=1 FL=1
MKERKIYDLVSSGDIPCTRVTGKWLFPRRLIDDWILHNTDFGPGAALPSPPVEESAVAPTLMDPATPPPADEPRTAEATTIAEAMKVETVPAHLFDQIRTGVDDIITVTEDQILSAMRHLTLEGARARWGAQLPDDDEQLRAALSSVEGLDADAFQTAALPLQDWLIVVVLAASVAPVLELAKWMERRGWFGRMD